MLEARSAYGYGYFGTNKGFDWKFIPNEFDGGRAVLGGGIFPDEQTAIKAGMKWLKRTKDGKHPRHGKIIAVKNKRCFGY